MTLDELRLRIEAAFPEAEIVPSSWPRSEGLRANFASPYDIGVGRHLIAGFRGSIRSSGELLVNALFPDVGSVFPHEALNAELEIERRILNLTGHQEMAIRRRFAGAAS